MKIFIPSRSRADRVAQKGRTLRQLIKTNLPHPYVVVPVGQKPQYEDAVAGRIPADNVLVCPYDGIAMTRQWCAEQAGNDKHFCMMDDDLGFLIRKAPGDWHLRGQEPEETKRMVGYIEHLLLKGYGAVGVSPREGNNRFDKCPNINTRLIRVLAFNTAEFLACEHGRVPVMEDFDVLLQLLRRGVPNAMTVNFAQGQKQTQEAGGCSDYRSHKLHAAAAEKLAELHEPFVRLRMKKNRSGGEFGTRKEVTIYWKKAYDSYQGWYSLGHTPSRR
jgi:hypothetical protein